MIQRIQSIYLLVITVLLITALCLPIGSFVSSNGAVVGVLKPLGLQMADGGFQSTWGVFGILLLGAVISFCTIFLYRNRMLQVRMTVFSGILLIGYYIVSLFFILMLKKNLEVASFQCGWALCLPAISIILDYLAFRAIYRDELMVKAADRLR